MGKVLLKFFIFFSSLFFSIAAFAQTFRGELDIKMFDDFKQYKAEKIFGLQEGANHYQLRISKDIDVKYLSSGDHVIVEGTLTDNIIEVESITREIHEPLTPKKITGTRSVISLLLNFNDLKTTNSTSIASIDQQMYTSNTSVRINYKRSSSGQFKFARVLDQNGAPPVYVVNLNSNAGNSCDYTAWANAAEAAASQAGINLSQYKHHMFVLPEDVNCPWGGLGSLGCGTFCDTWIVSGGNLSLLMAHELGHNLGLEHSATDLNNNGVVDLEYGDLSCIMGNGGYRQINAPHRDHLHWYDARPNKITTVTADGQFVIRSLDISTKLLQVLKINKPDNSGAYYVSYRTNHGPFGMGSTYNGKVSIHRTDTGDTYSYFIKALGNNETFTDPANGITVTANLTEAKKATVTVALN